jgi:HlyD family secretion protein
MKKILLFIIPFAAGCSQSGSTVKPQHKDIIETVYASGKIVPLHEYHLFALSSGVIKEKMVKEGDTVSPGTVIYRVDNDAPAARLEAARVQYENSQSNLSEESAVLKDIRLNMESAEAKFKNDSMNYFRLKSLLSQDAVSKSSVDNAYTAYTISLNQKKSAEEKYTAARNDLNVAMHGAKSQLAGAQSEYNNYSIASESSGTVYQLMKEAGEAVRPGEMVALLGESSGRIIRLAVDQQDIDLIAAGQQVLVKTDVTGNAVYHAVVTTIYPVMNEVDQTFRVDAEFKDDVQQPYVHSSVEANIIISEKKNALVIPRAAMIADDSIQVKTGGKVKNVFVKTGIRTLDDVEIISGIDESADVIIASKK